jgi:uncharacterized GH25 family protein
VLYRGKALAGVLVAAMRPGTTDTDVTARTDSNGRVQFSLRKGGAWRIAAVHMVAPAERCRRRLGQSVGVVDV